MFEFNVNYLSVFVAAVTGMAIGALWYGPLFGKLWMRLSGAAKERIGYAKKGMAKSYLIAYIEQFVMACVLSVFVGAFGASTALEGAMIGFWVWLGFFATTMLDMVLWEKKPFKLYLLKAAHMLVVLKVMGAILAVWN